MPVASESPTWNPVEETEEDNETAYTGFRPEETPQPPAAPAETELAEYAADDEGNNRGMFNLIFRKVIAQYNFTYQVEDHQWRLSFIIAKRKGVIGQPLQLLIVGVMMEVFYQHSSLSLG